MFKLESVKLFPLLLIIIIIGISPFIFALATSFSHDIYGTRSFAGLDNYIFLTGDKDFRYSIAITSAWSVITTLLTLTIAFFLAVKMSLSDGLYSKALYASLLIPWGIPVYIAVPLWRGIIHGNGGESVIAKLLGIKINLLTDSAAAFGSAVFVHLWLSVPITALVILGALKKIPAALTEAGRMDGAGPGIIIRHIYIPAVKNTLAAMGALLFVSALKEFTLIHLMTTGGPPLVAGITGRSIIGATTTLGVFLYELFNETSDFGLSSAYAVYLMGFVVLILFFWLFARGKIKNRKIPLLLVAAAQPLLSGWIGLIFCGLYIAALIRKRLYIPVLIAQIVTTLIMIILKGFLDGFQAGLLISILGVSLLFRGRQPKKAGFTRGSWMVPLPMLLPLLFILSSLLILLFLCLLSFSSGNIITFDGVIRGLSGASNFRAIFTETGLHRFFLNTIFLSLTASVVTPLICFPAASYLANRGKKAVTLFLLILQVLSVGGGIHTLLPLYSQFIKIGLTDSYIPLILIYCYHAVPFSMFTMTAYLETVPKSLYDQARIDGAGPLRYLFRIQAPLALPVIATTGIITFMNGWNSFLAPLLFLNDDSKFTISVKLFSMIGNLGAANPQWNMFAAASVLNLGIIAFIFAPLRRPLQTTALHDFDS